MFETLVKNLKNGDSELALRAARYNTDLREIEIIKKYQKSKNDIYLELYGLELGFSKFEIQDILREYNNAECERCCKKFSPKEQINPEGIVCDSCYEILCKGGI